MCNPIATIAVNQLLLSRKPNTADDDTQVPGADSPEWRKLKHPQVLEEDKLLRPTTEELNRRKRRLEMADEPRSLQDGFKRGLRRVRGDWRDADEVE